jgi:PPM family protein phosphatase
MKRRRKDEKEGEAMMEKGEDFLEEYSEPIQEAATPLLSVGEFVQHPEGNTQYQIQRVVTVQGWLCPYALYEVREIPTSSPKAPEPSSEEAAGTEQLTPTSEEPEATEPKRDVETPTEEFTVFWLWEAGDPERVAWLRKEADIFSNLNSPLFPKVRAQFAQGERFYLVTEPLPEKSLEVSLQQKELTFPDFLLILTQVAQGLVHLHQAGWVHSGLQPSCVLPGKPVKLVDLRQARRRDETELDAQGDVGVDVFSVGAILYHFIRGEPLSEAEISLTELQCRYAGVPQILSRCIGPKEDRYPNLQLLHEELKRLRRRYMPDITYDLFGATTIGLEPSRTTNEDAYGYLEGVIQTEAESLRWLIACVADGMGGMEAGEVASEAAVKTVLKEATKTIQAIRSLPSSEEQARWVKDWVHKANESVCEAMKNRRAKGGTTLSCAFLLGKRLAVAHVGDSRIYLFRGGNISLLTRDHSLAAVLALQEGKAGDLQYIRTHPDRNRLTRSLGERTPLPDYFVEGFSPELTQKATWELQDGDILLLCSDGVWEPVTEEDMVRVLQEHGDDLSQAAYEILDLVLQRGAHDNATVLLVRLKERQPVEVVIQAGGEKDAEFRPQTSPDAPEGSDG